MLHNLLTTIFLGGFLGGLSLPFLALYCKYRRSQESPEQYLQHWSDHDPSRERKMRRRGHTTTSMLLGLILGCVLDWLIAFPVQLKPWSGIATIVAMTVAGMSGISKMEEHEKIKRDYLKALCGASFVMGISVPIFIDM